MNKLLNTITLSLISSTVMAGSIHIMDMRQLGLTNEEIAKQEADKVEMRQKGYIETSTSIPKENMAMVSSKKSLFSAKNESDPYGSDLKQHLSNIKLTFNFKGISFIPKQNVIGYAVSGTYINGWTGIAEYFNLPGIGVCDYTILHAKANQGEVSLRKDLVTNSVNNKITRSEVIGNKQDGFVYSVNWYTEDFWHTLECVGQKFDKNMQGKVIELAKKIDKDFR